MKKKKKANHRYFTHAHNIEGCLQNGSFCRVWDDGRIAQYMNGDYMGNIDKLPSTMTEVSTELALDLLPNCCK